MRITFLQLTIAFVLAGNVFASNVNAQAVLETKISIRETNNPLSQVLQKLGKQYHIEFVYTTDIIDEKLVVNIDMKKQKLSNVLRKMLQPLNLSFDVVDEVILIRNFKSDDKMAPFPPTNAVSDKNAQAGIAIPVEAQVVINGKVTDEKGEPIPGVTVRHKETGQTVATGVGGEYTLVLPEASGTLSFSYLGYQTKEVAVSTDRRINVTLIGVSGNLNEVVVVGYGTQKKATVTGAVTAVKGSEIVKSPAINVASSLAGRLPGVIINSRSGEPGRDNPSISIRGKSTTGDASSLVIIDGVERGGLGQLNPNDIESVSVLKDASAAIYGARAANGVILVTTKRGTNGAPQVNLSFNQGFTQPTRNPIMADSYTFGNVYNEIERGEGRNPRYTDDELNKYQNSSDPDYPNTDWYNFIVKNWTQQHRTNLSVTGGNNGTTYFLSFGEVVQDGQYNGGTEKIRQYNIRSNVDVQITDNFKIGMNLSGRFDSNHFPYQGANNLNSHIFLYQPNWQPFWPGTDLPQPNRGNESILNWVNDNNGNQDVRTTTFQSTLFFNWALPWLSGLSINGSGSYDPNSVFTKIFQKPTFVYYKNATTGEYTRERSGMGANLADLNDRTALGSLFYLTSRINYERTFGLHNLKAFVGYEQQTTKSNFDVAYRSDFVSTVIPQIFAGSSDKSKQGNDGSATQGARKNYFGRINYDYAGKYLAEFTLRRDGSPNFASDKRWGNFPGASAGWRLSEEKFMKRFKFINDLKVRASYGIMGNDLVSSFQYLTTYGFGSNYVIGGNDVTGLVQTGAPNPDITWERAKTGNIGLDATFWNGFLGVTFDYFKTRRSNILTKRTAIIPGYTGLTLPDENIGIVDNKGFELVLSHTNNAHEFKYNFSGNIAFAKNKVIFSDEQPAAMPYQLATGRPIGSALYYNAIGIFADQAAIDGYPHYLNAKPGDIKYEDVNSDGKIDALDRIRIDENNVPQMTFGFTANLEYKNFDLSVLLQGQANAKQNFGGYFPVMSYSLGNFLDWRADGRWTPENTNATKPRASYELFNNNTQTSTQWLLNAGFLRFKNVELGYTLPKVVTGKIGVKNLRFSVSGSNLFVIYDHMKDLGFDPETNDYWYYPPQRVINFGVNVTL